MKYTAKPYLLEEVEEKRKKCIRKLIEYPLYIIIVVVIFFSIGMPDLLEDAIYYDTHPDAKTTAEILESAYYEQNPFAKRNGVLETTSKKEEAITKTYILAAVMGLIFIASSVLLFLNVKRYKQHSCYLSQLQGSYLEINGDLITGSSFATETSTPESFSIHLNDVDRVTHRYDKLNLVFRVGEKDYKCLEIDKAIEIAKALQVRIKEKSREK